MQKLKKKYLSHSLFGNRIRFTIAKTRQLKELMLKMQSKADGDAIVFHQTDFFDVIEIFF